MRRRTQTWRRAAARAPTNPSRPVDGAGAVFPAQHSILACRRSTAGILGPSRPASVHVSGGNNAGACAVFCMVLRLLAPSEEYHVLLLSLVLSHPLACACAPSQAGTTYLLPLHVRHSSVR